MKEILAFCLSCMTVESLYFTGDTLVPTRKFTQENGQIYHDCGSDEPCHLMGYLDHFRRNQTAAPGRSDSLAAKKENVIK